MKYAFITDIHEDIVKLRLAFRKIEKLACDEIICLGDISGFSVPHFDYYDTRNASECLRMIRENCKVTIIGNHDLYAARITPKINPNFEYPANWYSMDYYQRLENAKGKVWLYEHDELSPLYKGADIDFLKTLPEYHILNTQIGNIFLSHFIYPNLTGVETGFYSLKDEFEIHRNFMVKFNCEFGIAGHRHFSGLMVANKERMIEKRYNSKYIPKKEDCILVPPITSKHIGSGFCIFDDETGIVNAIRI